MPFCPKPSGALPSRFRRPRLLIIGCGDVGLRAVQALGRGRRVLALSSSPDRLDLLRAAGVVPLRGNLDDPDSLARLAGLATHVLHLAPPPPTGVHDPRTKALVRALARRSPPRTLIYISTSGVYGDCGGAWVSETRPLAPATPRARRRADAEAQLRRWGRRGIRVSLLRVSGIYGGNRAGGGARTRLLRRQPLPQEPDDPYVNRIHADDLARACVLALWRARPQRVYNVCDLSHLRLGEYFDLAADLLGLARLPRISLAQARRELTPEFLSFLAESRRLMAQRMQEELGLKLNYPTAREGLRADLGAQRG